MTGRLIPTSIQRCLFGVAIVASVAGCNRGPTYDFAQVSGTLRLDGRPMDQAMVEFVPDVGPSSVGYTDERGRYSLKTYTEEPGAVIGSHLVLVRDIKGYPTTLEAVRAGIVIGQRRIPDRYGFVAQTPLHKEVKTGGPQTIDLDVNSLP